MDSIQPHISNSFSIEKKKKLWRLFKCTNHGFFNCLASCQCLSFSFLLLYFNIPAERKNLLDKKLFFASSSIICLVFWLWLVDKSLSQNLRKFHLRPQTNFNLCDIPRRSPFPLSKAYSFTPFEQVCNICSLLLFSTLIPHNTHLKSCCVL